MGIGKVERSWQRNGHVVAEDGSVTQVPHGVDDADPVRINSHQTTELAYLPLAAADGQRHWHVPRNEDLTHLRAAFRQITEIGEREVREIFERVGKEHARELIPASETLAATVHPYPTMTFVGRGGDTRSGKR